MSKIINTNIQPRECRQNTSAPPHPMARPSRTGHRPVGSSRGVTICYSEYMDLDDFQQHALKSIAITQKDVAALAEYFDMPLSEVANANMQRSSDFAKSRNIK